MRKIITITILFLFQSLNVFSQEDREINHNWSNVKTQLELKTEVILKFTGKVKKSKIIDQSELKQTEIYNTELKKVLENKILNQATVSEIRKKNNELNTHLVRILVGLESDFKLTNDDSVMSLYDQLSNSEIQILAAIKKHNQSCVKQNKKELIFEIHGENKAPSVEF